MPTRSLDFYGAVGDGTTNNDAAIAAAIASGDNITVPAGNYRYEKSIAIPPGVTWEGTGYASNLVASRRDDGAADSGAIILTGTGSRLVNLRRTYTGGGSRTDWEKGHAVLVRFATDFTVAGCFLHSATSAGLLIRASTRGNVTGNLVRDTLADGIHVTGDSSTSPDGSVPGPGVFSSFINIHDNHVVNVGDDCIAVVSYVDHGAEAINRYVSIRGNQTSGGLARGITVIGGSHVTIAENVVVSPAYAGVLIDSEASYNTFGGTNIEIVDNVLIDTGSNGQFAYNSIQIGGRVERPFTNVMIKNNRLYGCRAYGIGLVAPATGAVVGVQVVGNQIDTVEQSGLLALRIVDLRCEGNAFRSVRNYGFASEGGAGFLKINDNVFTDINKGKQSYVDVIQVGSGAPFQTLEIRDNLHRDPNSNGIERLVECFYDNVIAENNFGGPVTLGVLPNPDDRQRVKAAAQANSSGADLPTIAGDFNGLLQRLRDAGLINN